MIRYLICRRIRRLACLVDPRGHSWDGYGEQPLNWIRCRKCGVLG